MNTKATVASGYRWRLIIIALGCLGWAGYCVYDARIGYPKKIEKYDAFVEFKEKNPDWSETWPAFAESKGWDTDEPVKKGKYDIATQWIMFALTAPIGVYCLSLAMLWQRRFIGVDDQAIYAYGDRSATWDQITSIDAQRWSSKGIAKVHYNAPAGQQTILLDDWKYERSPTTSIFKTLQAKVDSDKFEGLEQIAQTEEAEAEATEPAEQATDEESAISSTS